MTMLQIRIYAELHKGSFTYSSNIAKAMKIPYDDVFKEALNQLVDHDYVMYERGLKWAVKR